MNAGVALDIGTTTVQAQLVNLAAGEGLASRVLASKGLASEVLAGEALDSISVLNDQRSFGADVMTRIACARDGKTKELFKTINNQVEGILHHFTNKWNLQKIERCAVSANTTMLHLFMGTDPSSMGKAPYTPVFLEERRFNGSELSLSAEHVILLPGASAFVGADIICGLASLGVLNTTGNALFIDIGTNGEIAVWKGSEKRLLCCSTAAGPCFEGEKISYGSDLINAIAEMRRQGVIDETGAISGAVSNVQSGNRFDITQEMVRQFQLAKSAIYSGIEVLCRTAKVEMPQLDEVYIAGGMGFFINLENAAETGLLPRGIISNAQVCGNTSLKGARQSLTDAGFLQKCKEIIAHATVIDLAVDREFSESFIENMGFES